MLTDPETYTLTQILRAMDVIYPLQPRAGFICALRAQRERDDGYRKEQQ